MKRLFNPVVYTLLTLVAVVTLVPFAYLACSSVKTSTVFFSSPFLPVSGLFDLEPSTGSLSLVDTTHLDGAGPHRIDLAVEAYSLREERVEDRAEVTAVVSAGEGGEWRLDLAGPDGASLATAAEAFEFRDPSIQYRIARGNPRGFLGVAWGQLTWQHYGRLLTDLEPPFMRPVLNSFFFASVSAILATLCSALGGFALAKYRFRGRSFLLGVVLGCLIVPGAVMLAPLYQLIFRIGLLDTYAGMILPGLAPAFGVFLFRQALINGLPNEMMEAARIDGCSEARIFFVIALPMVRPMISAFLLITYLGAWNNFIWPQIILQTPEKLPLAVAIAQLNDVYAVDYGMLMSGTLVSILPVLLLFLLLQKEFIAGLTAGAVKG